MDERHHIAAAIAKALDGRRIDDQANEDIGRVEALSLGVTIGGRLVPRDRYGVENDSAAVEWNAVIRLGPAGGDPTT